MTNPTREEIQTAHEALETLTNTCIHSADQAEELQELVLRALPPKPRPTMEDVEWDDDVHYLAEAESDLFGTVIMLAKNEDGHIEFFDPKSKTSRTDESLTRTLTPTGRRYTLTEVQE